MPDKEKQSNEALKAVTQGMVDVIKALGGDNGIPDRIDRNIPGRLQGVDVDNLASRTSELETGAVVRDLELPSSEAPRIVAKSGDAHGMVLRGAVVRDGRTTHYKATVYYLAGTTTFRVRSLTGVEEHLAYNDPAMVVQIETGREAFEEFRGPNNGNQIIVNGQIDKVPEGGKLSFYLVRKLSGRDGLGGWKVQEEKTKSSVPQIAAFLNGIITRSIGDKQPGYTWPSRLVNIGELV